MLGYWVLLNIRTNRKAPLLARGWTVVDESGEDGVVEKWWAEVVRFCEVVKKWWVDAVILHEPNDWTRKNEKLELGISFLGPFIPLLVSFNFWWKFLNHFHFKVTLTIDSMRYWLLMVEQATNASVLVKAQTLSLRVTCRICGWNIRAWSAQTCVFACWMIPSTDGLGNLPVLWSFFLLLVSSPPSVCFILGFAHRQLFRILASARWLIVIDAKARSRHQWHRALFPCLRCGNRSHATALVLFLASRLIHRPSGHWHCCCSFGFAVVFI